MKSWLQGIECSTHNEEKFVIVERYIRSLKNKIYKYMTSISKKNYIDKLEYIINKYNNTYHSTIKMKPVDVKPSTCINFKKKNSKKDPNFEVGDHARVSKYETIFAKR